MESGADIISLALAEDIGTGDVTAQWFVPAESRTTARLVAREDCTLAGSAVAAEVFQRVDPRLVVEQRHWDGNRLSAGDFVLEVSGSTASILTAERTALNFIQRLSGVATLTRRFVDAVEGTGAVILDTRKTTPGFRHLEKAAVAAAGATNHRIGLFDMVMVKDNHLAAGTGDLAEQIEVLKREAPHLRVEVEADTLDQARQFFEIPGIDIVLLDNMSLDELCEAVRSRPEGIQLEASGGVTLNTVRAIAETGVDFISVGALTHSAPAIDFALDVPA
ncbi:MAG: carboxylating nicotinate-nucleotide diphosphorylase [Terrimicrobiaceae bacterium]|nr:carboxylating nicotinate-nucleotide diphosphorylase [Terrimicrobiaceae bacterium]